MAKRVGKKKGGDAAIQFKETQRQKKKKKIFLDQLKKRILIFMMRRKKFNQGEYMYVKTLTV